MPSRYKEQSAAELFEITIDGQTKRIGPGDAFLIPSRADHAAHFLEEGEIVEVFTPIREDFFPG